MTDSIQIMTVESPGSLTIPVDAGRQGIHHQGLTSGGALDQQAFYWANQLCGNEWGKTCLEVTYGGLQLRVVRRCVIAVTGADMPLSINGREIARWQTHTVHPGDLVSLAPASTGMRCYLAIKGGFDVASQFGSASAVPRERLGGARLNGQGLCAGDSLKGITSMEKHACILPEDAIPQDAGVLNLRVICSYQYQSFSQLDLARFFSSSYRVTERMDRMGICLHGAALSSALTSLSSEGICLGAVQIPPDGQPIIMLNDRQTIGGYPKVGAVLSLDCSRLAQARPGTEVTFERIDMLTAHNLIVLERIRRARQALSLAQLS